MKRAILIIFTILTIQSDFVFADDTTVLRQTSKAFARIAKKATPCVVFIKAEYNSNDLTSKKDDYNDPFEYFNDEFFKRFFNNPRMKQEPQFAAGSGCLVTSDGYILTNNHIVKDSTSLIVSLNSGEEYSAKVIGTDQKTDLAVIKIDAKDLPYLEFADSDALEIGEWVIAIGSPFQLQSSVTVGVVSAKGRQNLRITDLEDFIQTDAAINPGNSGGPLLDIDGKIVGINTAIISQSGGYMGIGFAIPSNMAKQIYQQIVDNGLVKRGHLGIYFQSVDKEIVEALDLENTDGVLISEVVTNSAADKAGLKQGDIILSYNGNPIKSFTKFRNEMALMEPNQLVTFEILREGKKKTIKATLGISPDIISSNNKASFDLGIEVSDLKDVSADLVKKYQYQDNLEGVLITSVKNNSIAMRYGLKPGMLIQQINNKKISNIADFSNALKDAEKKKNLLTKLEIAKSF